MKDRLENYYLTPLEIMDKYPQLAVKFNWTANDLGILLKCRILEGYYDRSKRNSMINEASLKRLISYVNGILESQKVRLP